jgi:hypothetical protein
MKTMRIQGKLPVQISKQGKRYIAYTPVLDLSTSGRTEKEARTRFAEIVGIFFEELIEAGTVGKVLQSLGWQKAKTLWQPPKIVSNEQVSVSIPVMA